MQARQGEPLSQTKINENQPGMLFLFNIFDVYCD